MKITGPVVLASRNDGKRRELERLSAGAFDLRILPADAPEVVEDGATYFHNAQKKAREIARFTNGPALADDSGLEVDALGGRPGVFSARYGGAGLDDVGRTARLLEELGDETNRRARFRCVLVLVDGDECVWSEGTLEGAVAEAPRGDGGFGYDPIFIADVFGGRTLAEVAPEEKNDVSHRAVALRALVETLGLRS